MLKFTRYSPEADQWHVERLSRPKGKDANERSETLDTSADRTYADGPLRAIRTKGSDGWLLFSPPLHVGYSVGVYSNDILGPLSFGDLHELACASLICKDDAGRQHSVLEAFLAAHGFGLDQPADQFLGDAKDASDIPYLDWLHLQDTKANKLKRYMGYYILGVE